jgi:hypothetical protein
MKIFMRLSVMGILVSAFGLGMSACALEDATEGDLAGEAEEVAEVQQELVTCSTNCSATGGPSITKTCNTCSADDSSITCNGVTTQCQSLPSCFTKCKYGVCSSCSEDGYPTTCYIHNGCGGKYPTP